MIIVLFALLLQTTAAAADPAISTAPLTLQEALVLAEEFSPDLKAAQARELQVENQISIGESYLYPSLHGQAGVGYAFLGGDNSLLGLEQLTVSPAGHVGPIGGFYSSLEVFNASTYRTIALAKRNVEFAKALLALTRYQVDLETARAYFEAARDLGGATAWREAGREMQKLLSEVQSLVRSGYQNPVDALLVKDEVSEAQIEQAADTARYRAALDKLGALIGKNGDLFSCAPASALAENSADVFSSGVSPYLQIGLSQVKVAKATVLQKSAKNYPVVSAAGGVDTGLSGAGYVSPNRDYSFGVGIGLPLFEGYRVVEQTKQAKNLLSQRRFDLSGADVQIGEQNADYDKAIDAARIELSGLSPEYADDQTAVAMARKRYRDFQGPLVDVREALRDLARVSVEQNDAAAELLFSLAGKSLLNGGTVRR
ncbi:MAG: TolC family protein [Elusimicrobia bacterium]|nr:TolC family protein [Elusimicrobiota bacterium]